MLENNIANKFGIVGSASRTKDVVGDSQKNNYIKYGTIGKKKNCKISITLQYAIYT